MGLREKIALVLTTVAITQIIITQCMPSASRMSSLQRHLEARGIKSTQSILDNVAKVAKTAPPKRSIYKTYNFPETEYPIDSSPRDPFYYGTHLDSNPLGLSENAVPIQIVNAFNDLKKDMRMKRKLNMINENYQASSGHEPNWLKDKEIFPAMQYPLNTIDTWTPYYGTPSVLTQNENSHKLPELLSEISKRTSDPNKEELKSKNKRFLDEINKIKEKISSSKTHSQSGTDTIRFHSTKGSPTAGVRSSEYLIKPELNTTVISLATRDLPKEDATNSTIFLDRLQMGSQTETSVKPIINPYKESGTPIIWENKGNNAVPPIIPSTNTQDTTDQFQQVIADTLIHLILTHISKKTNMSQALVINDTDTRTYKDSDAKSAYVQKDQDTVLMPNDDPLNVKLPLPVPIKDKSIATQIPIENVTQKSDVNKAPSIIVIPVSDSINKIRLPVVETSTGAPIIVFIPTTQHINSTIRPSADIPDDLPFITETASNVLVRDVSNISPRYELSQTEDVSSENSMCHGLPEEVTNTIQQNKFIEKNEPILTVRLSSQDNSSSVFLDHQSSNRSEILPNICVQELTPNDKIIVVDNLPPTIEEALTKSLLLEKNTGKGISNVSTIENTPTKPEDTTDIRNISITDTQKVDLPTVEDNLPPDNALVDENNETNIPYSRALSVPDTQKDDQSKIEDYMISDKTLANENKEATSGKRLETLETGIVNPTLLDKMTDEKLLTEMIKDEVLHDTPSEDIHIQGRSVSDGTKDLLMNNTQLDNELKHINKKTPMPMNDELALLQDSLILKNQELLTVPITANESPLFCNGAQEDTQVATKAKECAGISKIDSKEISNSLVNQPLEQHQFIYNTKEPLIYEELSDSLLQGPITPGTIKDFSQTDNPSDKNEGGSDSVVNEDFFSVPITDIIKDELILPNGNMLICSGIYEVPKKVTRRLVNGSLSNNGTVNYFLPIDEVVPDTPAAKIAENVPTGKDKVLQNKAPTDSEEDVAEKDKALSVIHRPSHVIELVETPVNDSTAGIPLTDLIDDILYPLSKTVADIIIATDINEDNKAIEDTFSKSLKEDRLQPTDNTELGASSTKTNRDIKQLLVNNTLTDRPHSNIVDDNVLPDAGFGNVIENKTILADKKQPTSNNIEDFKPEIGLSETKRSKTIKESKALLKDKTVTGRHLTDDNMSSTENLSSDSKVIKDAPQRAIKNKPPLTAENDVTSAELSDLIKYLYAAL